MLFLYHYDKKDQTVMVTNFNNINNKDNQLSPQLNSISFSWLSLIILL